MRRPRPLRGCRAIAKKNLYNTGISLPSTPNQSLDKLIASIFVKHKSAYSIIS
jgi:hypothetical protein